MPTNALPILPPPLQQRLVDARVLLTVPWALFFRWILGALAAPTYAEGTHIERIGDPASTDPALNKGMPASTFRPGAFFWETDRSVLYQAAWDPDGDPAWVYVSGTMRDVLANKPADLGDNDTGFLFYGTDYAHTWRWTGTAWQYAPGDRIAGEIAWFTEAAGTGWALCNGAAVTRTTAVAGTAAFTTPNLIGAYAKGGSTYTGALVPASGSASGTTDAESGHTHAVTTGAVTTGLGSGDVFTAASAAGFGTRWEWHVHDVPGQTVTSAAGSAHNHTITGLTLSGVEPQHVDLLPYFRL